MADSTDEIWMRKSLELAAGALARGEVPVGCIFVYEGVNVGQGSNEVNATKNATRHAEFIAIDHVRTHCKEHGLDEHEVFKNSTLFVTTEPCIMCSAALRIVGVRSVIFGCPNPRFGGCGSVLDAHTKEFQANWSGLSVRELCTEDIADKNDKCFTQLDDTGQGTEHVKHLQSRKDEYCKHELANEINQSSSIGCNSGVSSTLFCRGGVLANDSVSLLKQFYQGENPNAPNPKDKSTRKK